MRKILLLVALFLAISLNAQDSRYDAGLNLPFNEKAGDVNPQTGNLTLGFTDVSLPGRAGFDFTFGRTWSLNQSNVFNMYQDGNGANKLSSNTVEKHYRMGVGWSNNIPYIMEDNDSANKVLNLFFGGNVYEINQTSVVTNNPKLSNLLGYDLVDMRIFQSQEIDYVGSGINNTNVTNYGLRASTLTERSKYCLLLKNNEKYWFSNNGELMMASDKSEQNKIWYFYDTQNRLKIVIDSIGRVIRFLYDTTSGNLIKIEWDIKVGEKGTNGERNWNNKTRSVEYSYIGGERFPDVMSLKGDVLSYKMPYLLEVVTDPMGNKAKYEYDSGMAGFTFNSEKSHWQNVYLMIVGIMDKWDDTDGKYKNKRVFEYETPSKGLYTKWFYKGYMEYYKVSREYYISKDGNEEKKYNDTRYIYHENGEMGNQNQYTTVIEIGRVRSTYTYLLGSEKKKDNVLANIVTESEDGYLETRELSYDSKRAKTGEIVYHNGKKIYEESYIYDDKGNLINSKDRMKLETERTYDYTYSVPLTEVQKVTVEGTIREYRKKNVLTTKGQIKKQIVYINNIEVVVSDYSYDETYGNMISKTDANNNTMYIEYDDEKHCFPVKIYQDVSIDKWNDTAGNYWTKEADGNKKARIRSWKVFNNDGTLWIEVDNEGYAKEHYYDNNQQEIEVVNPDLDDIRSFAEPIEIVNKVPIGDDFKDFFTEYLAKPENANYLQKRQNNSGARIKIDYREDKIKTYADIDKANNSIKITEKISNGLGMIEEEIEYKDGTKYSIKKMTYDKYGRMIGLTDPDAGDNFVIYDVDGEKVKRYDKTWIIKYDDVGRQKEVYYPKNEEGKTPYKYMEYDDVANIIKTVDPEGRVIVEKKDWNGNVVEIVRNGDSNTKTDKIEIVRFKYDELNRKIEFVDAKGIVTKYRYDERSLLVEQRYVEGSDLMVYNNLGQLVQKTDRNGNIIKSYYDQMGRNTKMEQYRSGNAQVEEVIKLSYDNRGNAIRIANSNLIEHYIYDYGNRVIKLKRRLKSEEIRTKLANTVWSGAQSEQIFSYGYVYNDAGMVTQMTYPDGNTHNFTYDGQLGRLESIKNGVENFVEGFAYTKSGVVNKMYYGNNTYQEWEFDNRKRIKHIKIANQTETIAELNYKLNGVGDVLSINNNEYKYDGFDRLIGAKTQQLGTVDNLSLVEKHFGTEINKNTVLRTNYNPLADLNHDGRINGEDHCIASLEDMSLIYDVESFEYDKNGNRTKLTQNEDIYFYSYGVQNKLTKVEKQAKGSKVKRTFAEYLYDKNGNTTKRTITRDNGQKDIIDFTYDTMNRLLSTVENGSKTTRYYYDNAGNRFIKKTEKELTLYLRHGQIAVAMDIEIKDDSTTDKGKINRYVLSGDLLAGKITKIKQLDDSFKTVKEWYHLDHLNSTKAVTNQDGKREALYEYRSFGEELRKLGSGKAKYTYGGKELDSSTNLYYFNARYYDATIGRFINVDPVQSGLNWYVYANNNPLNRVDPTGLEEKNILEKSIDFVSSKVTSVVDWYNKNERLIGATTTALGIVEIAAGLAIAGGGTGTGAGLSLSTLGGGTIAGIGIASSSIAVGATLVKGGVATATIGLMMMMRNGKDGTYSPNRKLPRDDNGNPIPDSQNPHTQLGKKDGRNGEYNQAREWGKDENGKLSPKKDIDFTDHGRPNEHTNPHQHKFTPNETGGTPKHGHPEPLD